MVRRLSAIALAALLATAWHPAVATEGVTTAIVPEQRWQKEVLDAPDGLAADAERAYFITADRKLTACALQSGDPLWAVAVAGLTEEAALRMVEGVLVVQPKGSAAEAHDPVTGTHLWTWAGSWWPKSTGVGLLRMDRDTAHLIDPRTGLDRAKAPLADGSVVGVSASFVYTKVAEPPAARGLYRTSLRDGSRRLVSGGVYPSYVVEVAGQIVCIDDLAVTVLRAIDGQKLWTREQASGKRNRRVRDPLEAARAVKVFGGRVWMIDGYQVTEIEPASGRIVSSTTLPSLDELDPLGLKVQLVHGQKPLIAARIYHTGYWASLGEKALTFYTQPELALRPSLFVGDTLLGMSSGDADSETKQTSTLTALALTVAGRRVPLPHHEPSWVTGATTRAAVVTTSHGTHDVSPKNLLVVESLPPAGPALRKEIAGSYTLRYVPERKGYLLLGEHEMGAALMIAGIGYFDEPTRQLTWADHNESEEDFWGAWAFAISDDAHYVAFVGTQNWRRPKLQVLDTVTDRLVTLGPPPPPIERPDEIFTPFAPPLKGWNDERLDHVIYLAPGMMSMKDGILKVAYGKPGKKSTPTRTWDLRRRFGKGTSGPSDKPRKP